MNAYIIAFVLPMSCELVRACNATSPMASISTNDKDVDLSTYEQPSTYHFHHFFNLGVAALVKSLIVRDKRQIYVSMRSGFVTPDSFFPRFGMSASDFAVWQILIENPRRCVANPTASTTIQTPDELAETQTVPKPETKERKRRKH